MQIKRLFLLFISIFAFTVTLSAQKLTVESLVQTNDAIARSRNVIGTDGNVCAAVVVRIPSANATFDGGFIIGKPAYKNGEYIIDMQTGAAQMRVSVPGYNTIDVKFRDYLGSTLQSKTTYLLTINLPQSGAQQKMQTLNIKVTPSDAIVQIDGDIVETKALILTVGTHRFNVVAKGFYPQEGTIEVTEKYPAKLTVDLDRKLQNSVSNEDLNQVFNIYGASFCEIDENDKKDYGTSFGVKITSLDEGEFCDSGLPIGFIIQEINDKSIKNIEELQEIIANISKQNSPVLYVQGIKTTGKKAYFAVLLSPQNQLLASTPELSVDGMLPQTFTVNGVSFTMMPVEGGTFTMGATAEQGSGTEIDEKPTHQVTLSSYYIGKYEVTQDLWQAVLGKKPSKFKGDAKPVEKVSWYDCQQFISELNSLTEKHFRLPTEAEWEFAARGGVQSQSFKYSGSNNIDDVAWYADNSESTTHDVGTKSPNELGIYDMSGNVWEWCNDWFDEYNSNAQTNPTGSASGTSRVFRGGSWSRISKGCRTSYRFAYDPKFKNENLGLRLVLSE